MHLYVDVTLHARAHGRVAHVDGPRAVVVVLGRRLLALGCRGNPFRILHTQTSFITVINHSTARMRCLYKLFGNDSTS